jgi:heme A synthase
VDLRRLRAGEVIAGLSGVVLILALLLPWYTREVVTSFGPRSSLPSPNAFESMAVADLLLLVVAIAAIGLAVDTALEKTVAVPLTWASLLLFASLVAFFLVLFHLGAAPVPEGTVPAETRVETSTAAGAWLALLATVAMFAGSLLAMRDERLSKGGRLTDQTGRPVDRAPKPEQLATPR